MTFVLYAVAAIYAISIVFVAALLGTTLWSERRTARATAAGAPVTMVRAETELSDDAPRTSVA